MRRPDDVCRALFHVVRHRPDARPTRKDTPLLISVHPTPNPALPRALFISIMPVMMWLEKDVISGLTRGALIQLLLVLPAMFFAGGRFFRGAWLALRHRAATMDTLVAIGAGSAFVYSIASMCIGLADPTYEVNLVFDTSTMVPTQSARHAHHPRRAHSHPMPGSLSGHS